MISPEDIILRPVQLSDAQLVLEWENNESNWSVSDTQTSYTLGEIIDLIEALEKLEEAKQARFIIVDQKTNKRIGAVDLFDIDFNAEVASVGILVADSELRSKGVASAAIAQLEIYCEDELGILNLKATVHNSNTASIRLFEKSGFSKKKLTQDAQLNNGDYIETLIFEKCLKK